MTETPLRGRVGGAEPVAVDVVLSSGGKELRHSRRRNPFWLETSSGRIWVEATDLTVVEGARKQRKQGPWSRISQLPEAGDFRHLAIGPHVDVELVVHTVEGGSHVAVTGVLGRRASAVAPGGDYRSDASEPVMEAKRIDARRWTREREKRAPGEPGWAALAALSIVAGLIVAFMARRIPLDSPFEIWAWSGWWALLVVAGSIVLARRYGYPHVFPDAPYWDFVPQFAEVSGQPVHDGFLGTRGVWLFALGTIVNLTFTSLYVLIGVTEATHPDEPQLTELCLLLGSVNHVFAWIWLTLRLVRTRSDARRLQALLKDSTPAWTVREGQVDAPIERHVHYTLQARARITDHGFTQRWTGTHVAFESSNDGPTRLALDGALVAGSGELVERTKADVRKQHWRYDTAGRWLVGYAGLPRSEVAASGSESLLVFTADAPIPEARLALFRRRATVIALTLTGAAGALATAAHAILTHLTY